MRNIGLGVNVLGDQLVGIVMNRRVQCLEHHQVTDIIRLSIAILRYSLNYMGLDWSVLNRGGRGGRVISLGL